MQMKAPSVCALARPEVSRQRRKTERRVASRFMVLSVCFFKYRKTMPDLVLYAIHILAYLLRAGIAIET